MFECLPFNITLIRRYLFREPEYDKDDYDDDYFLQ